MVNEAFTLIARHSLDNLDVATQPEICPLSDRLYIKGESERGIIMAKAPASLSKAKQAYTTLTSGGTWNHDQACGIVANIEAESNFNEHAIGDGGTAYGICQWHSDRQLNFRKHFGHDIRSGTFDEQVQFITHEMTAGTEKHAGHVLKTAQSAHDAGVIVSRFYERPQDGDGHVSAGRGRRADDWSKLLP